MALELKVPPAGESITEVQIGEWLKKEGDIVRQEETLVVIETDKVTVELPAPADGVLSKIVVQSGSDARVGDVIGLFEPGAVAHGERSQPPPPVLQTAPAPAVAPVAPVASTTGAPPEVAEEASSSVRESLPPQAFARVMPSARRAAAEGRVDPTQVTPTGPGGRVLKEDVQRHLAEQAERASSPLPPSVSEPRAAAAAASFAGRVLDPRGEEIVKMTPMRRTIAERLVQAQQGMALLTTFNEVDMSAVLELRKQHQEAFVAKYGHKLGLMSFFVKAAVEALKEFPSVNAETNGREILYKNYYDIGVAVGGGKGLVVPVIRDADRLSFSAVEKTIADFGVRAKANTLKLEELSGGTFSISNGGVYGSMLSTPIVNPPQSGILGLHNIVERPVAVAGKVEIRPIMYLALSYDHRIVDGREAVSFLRRVKLCVEEPARILLEV